MKEFPAHYPATVDLWVTLSRIQLALQLTDQQLADLLALPARQMLALRAKNFHPPATHVFGLADELHISIPHLLKGTLNYRALAELYRKNVDYIPAEYSIAAHSKRRSAIPILAYLRNFYGDFFVDRVLKHFQIHPVVFENPDDWISIRFTVELCEFLKRSQGFQESDFIAMGRYSVDANQGSFIETAVQAMPSPKAVYEELVGGLVNHYDETWQYSLQRLNSKVAEVKVSHRPAVAEALKTKTMGSALLCALKSGVGSSLLGYQGLPHSEVKHTKCIHRGDSHCLYEFDFSRANHASQLLQTH